MYGKRMNFVSAFDLINFFGSNGALDSCLMFSLPSTLAFTDLQQEYRDFLVDSASELAITWPPLD